MNALTKPIELNSVESNISAGKGDILLFAGADLKQSLGQSFEKMNVPFSYPPRREPWPGEERSTPWYSRLAAAIGRLLEPRQPRYPLTEHLCRDIGLDWTPEPRVRTWPW